MYLISIVDSILREVSYSNGEGCLFYLLIKQVTCYSFGQHTSLPYFNLQISFRGNLPPLQSNEGALSATLVGEYRTTFLCILNDTGADSSVQRKSNECNRCNKFVIILVNLPILHIAFNCLT